MTEPLRKAVRAWQRVGKSAHIPLLNVLSMAHDDIGSETPITDEERRMLRRTYKAALALLDVAARSAVR